MPVDQPATTRPRIAVNMAMTADGKISGPRKNGSTSSKDNATSNMSGFGSARDHRRLLKIRSGMDAVMCGRGTVEAADVDLGPGTAHYERLRVKQGLERFNRRIVVSASGRLNPGCRVFTQSFSPVLIATTRAGRSRCESYFEDKPWIRVHAFGEESIQWRQLVSWLGSHWGIRRMVVEGGGMLNDAMFRHDLVDELFLTICPLIFGGNSNATLSDGTGFPKLADAARFRCIEKRCVDGERFLRFVKA